MKVLFLTGMYPTPEYPQKGIFCHEQVKALKKLNIDMDVVVILPLYDKEARIKEWEFEGVKIHYLRFFKLPRAYDFHRTGVYLYCTLKHRFHIAKYDLIHADSALPTGYAAMLASKKYHIPYIVHGHGLDVFLEKSYQGYRNCSKIGMACKKAFAHADAVVGVSQKVLDKIEACVPVKEKSYVAFNGVDTEQFVPAEHKNSVVKFISVGNLIPLKGHEYTIRAARQLVEKGYTNFHLDIVGRGFLEEELKGLADKLEISSYVTFHGYIPYDKVRSMMQMSDVFVMPSYYEALGCVYLEAMACGLPVIGCLKNGIDEVFEDGKQGFLIENKNLEQLTEAMEKLLDCSLSVQMGKAARELVTARFKWIDSAESVATVYRKVHERIDYAWNIK